MDARHLKPVTASFPPEVVEAFVAATTTAFQELTGTEVQTQPPYLATQPSALGVTATVVLRHDPPGALLLSFPIPVLEVLAARYLGDPQLLNPEMLDDAAGEFANVIAGQAKTMLKGKPAHYLLTTPVVTHDAVATAVAGDLLTWQFACDAGTFTLQTSLR